LCHTPAARFAVLALLAVVALFAGCGGGAPAYRASAMGTVPAAAPTTSSTTAPALPPAPGSSKPVRLRIQRLGMDAPVVAVGILPAGDLDVPEDPSVIGWWAGGARPGGAKGSVVLDGHVDSAEHGLGVFAALRSAQVGDVVEVVSGDGGSRRYTVTARREYAKSSLPAAEVFSQDVAERLVLVTCGGRFDRATRHYDDNIVVYAVPAD
jgi:Sortase domain